MRQQQRHLIFAAFLLVSVFGLAVSASLLANPARSSEGSLARRMLVTSIYGSICALGILAALFPVACCGVLGIQRSFTDDQANLERRATKILGRFVVHGHHPSEQQAMLHEFRLFGKSFCAHCYGLLTGATVALAMAVAFALSGWPTEVDSRLAYAAYSAGILGVSFGFIQAIVSSIGARTRFVIAVAFVVGTSLMIIATDVLTASLTSDLFVLLLVVFWLLSRISMSDPN